MSGIKSMFKDIFPLTDDKGGKPFALLGDGSTTCAIEGYGYATYWLNGHPIWKLQLYVPALKISHLTSILQHSKYKGCYFHSENKKAALAFPPTIINADCKGDITIKIDPITTASECSKITYMFDEQYATPASDDTTKVAFYPAPYNQFIEPEDAKNLSEKVKIQKLDTNAKIPERATNGSVGYNLHAPISTIIPASQSIKIPLNFAISTPSSLYPLITDCSSLASKGITICGGIIDNDYRGNVIVCLHNETNLPFCITKHDSIAQLIFEKNGLPCIEHVNELDKTNRGKGGSGSTSKRCTAFRVNDQQVMIMQCKNQGSSRNHPNSQSRRSSR